MIKENLLYGNNADYWFSECVYKDAFVLRLEINLPIIGTVNNKVFYTPELQHFQKEISNFHSMDFMPEGWSVGKWLPACSFVYVQTRLRPVSPVNGITEDWTSKLQKDTDISVQDENIGSDTRHLNLISFHFPVQV